MMKSVRTAGLLLFCICLCLAACTKEKSTAPVLTSEGYATEESLREYRKLLDPKTPVTVRVWHYYNGVQKRVFDEMVEEFNRGLGAESGIVVESYSKGGTTELVEELLRAANREVGANELPNLSTSYSDSAWELDQKEALSDLKPYFTKEETEAFVSDFLKEGELHRSGQFKIMPIAKSTEVMILNKTDWEVFAEETGSELSELATMEGLVQVAKKYYDWTDRKTEEPNDGRAFFGRDAVANYIYSGMKELSGDLVGYDEQGKLKSDTNREAVRLLYDHFYLPYVYGYFASDSRFRSDDMRIGNIICFVGSSTSHSYLKGEVVDKDGNSRSVEYEVLPVPHFRDAARKIATQQGAGMVLLKSDSTSEYASTVFLKWLAAQDNNVKFTIQTGYLPVLQALYEKEAFREVLKAQGIETSPIQEKSYHVGMETVKNCDLTLPVAFNRSFQLRRDLETMMVNGAQNARELYRDLLTSEGEDSAKEKIKDEEIFEVWYQEFVRTVEKYCQDGE